MIGPSATTETKSVDTRRNSKAAGTQAQTPIAAQSNRANLRLMRKCACGGGPDCDCDIGPNKHRKTDLHRSATQSSSGPGEAPPIVHDVLRSPGTALDPGTRAFFESRFGRDFGAVRLHTDSRAAQSARAVHAHAYAVGNDIAFAAGKYAPSTPSGRSLLAHELAHTVQQPSSATPTSSNDVHPKLTIGAVNDPLEAEADRVADHVMRMADPNISTSSATPQISRKCSACEDEDKKLRPKSDGMAQPANEAPPVAHDLALRATSPTSLHRASDFSISGVNPNTAAAPSTIFFDLGSSTIPPSETAKITAAASPPTTPLKLNGYSSEEGTPAQNVPIVNARIGAVQTALLAAGHTGPITPNPQPAAGEGQLDYRSVRAVEIVPAGGASSTRQCQVTAANPHPENEPCGSAFFTAQPLSFAKVNNAFIAVTTSSAAATAKINTIFPGVPAATIIAKLASLMSQLIIMTGPGGAVCHNSCDGACARPGFMSGQGASAVMTLCPDFFHTLSLDDRVEMLMHESLHATIGAAVEDESYRRQRLIGVLTGAQAATNTDSYVSLILLLQPGATSPLAGGPPVDIPNGLSSAEGSAAERALAFLEKWVEIAEWDTSQLYEAIKHNIGRAGGWDPVYNYHAETQHAIGWLLQLTDPGNVAPFLIPPVREDQVKVAGIHDRYNRMNGVVDGTKITMSKGATEAWAPGPGASFVVKSDFFGIAPGDQVVRLLTLLAASMPDIPAALRSNYADAANQIRWHKTGIGP